VKQDLSVRVEDAQVKISPMQVNSTGMPVFFDVILHSEVCNLMCTRSSIVLLKDHTIGSAERGPQTSIKSLQRSSITVINVAVASLLATLPPAIAAAEFKR
jgi:hypothetical protein